MIAILTSSLGGSRQVNGTRIPTRLLEENGLLDRIKARWKADSDVLLISASPDEYEKNDAILSGQREAFAMSGLSVRSFELCDGRNEEIIENIDKFDVLLLFGGHVPTQNRFLKALDLKKRLAHFDGMLLALSAGSMNCAETVYAQPELEGEGTDAAYQRFLSGLGITKRMIIPHFQTLRDDMLDGLRIIEDITYPDSKGREFIALNDGSYIVSENGAETLYGEAYRIKDGEQTQICSAGQAVVLDF